MERRHTTGVLALALTLGLLATACGGGGVADADRPSVILVVVDTLRADHLGCYGYGGPTSPNLDDLAGQGVRFDQLVSAAPWTLPSVVSLMTSTWPSVHGAAIWDEGPRTIDTPIGIRGIDQRVTTLATAFQQAGYPTRAWVTNPWLASGSGIERGFDHYLYRHYPEVSGQADAVIEEVVQWLDSDPAEPFFLYLHLNDPHHPHFPRPENYPPLEPILGALPPGFDPSGWKGMTSVDPRSGPDQARLCRMKIAFYDAAVAFTDHQLGRLIRQLRPPGVALSTGRTVLAVVSDHGEEFWDHSVMERECYNDPRGTWGIGHGQSQYQELLRVPLIIAGPGLPAGTVAGSRGRSVDLAPTLLDLAGVPRPATMEGRSLRPFWDGGGEAATEGRDAFGESIAYGTERKAIVSGDWKYIVGLADGLEELYHLGHDPMEQVNLAARERGRITEMRRRLQQHLADCAGRRHWSGERLALQGRMVEELQALGYVE
jgi:arylsulfatase A-like enzyme